MNLHDKFFFFEKLLKKLYDMQFFISENKI